jgi:hypothetical protein
MAIASTVPSFSPPTLTPDSVWSGPGRAASRVSAPRSWAMAAGAAVGDTAARSAGEPVAG